MCTSALTALLSRPVDSRLGATLELPFFSHPFFSSFSPTELEARQIRPLFVPDEHCANFDATYDLEELLLEEAPLEARRRPNKPRPELPPTATDAERRKEAMLRLMEGDFEPFDYTRPKSASRVTGLNASQFPPSPLSTVDLPAPPRTASRDGLADSEGRLRGWSKDRNQGLMKRLPPRSVPDSVDITTHPREFSAGTQSHTPIGSQSDSSSFTNPEPGRNVFLSKFRLSKRPSREQFNGNTSMKSTSTMNSTLSHTSISPPVSTIIGQEPSGRKKMRSKERSKTRRGKSPALLNGENGVLGREGARVIVK